jgi:peptidoglycan/xylan/chitin deacetylase (PgdA/CDA1 family)
VSLKRVLRPFLSEGMIGGSLTLRALSGMAVLCYHNVLPDDAAEAIPFADLHVTASSFAAHCQAIARYCSPISLADWRRHCATGEPLPPRPVLVTFDDGYATMRHVAEPILRAHGIPAVMFICSAPVERGELFWYDAVARTLDEAAVDQLKTASYENWRAALDAQPAPVATASVLTPLRPRDVAALASDPLIEIGAHTHTHPILRHAPPAVQEQEIALNLERLTAWTGRRPTAFAYPNGRPTLDFDVATQRALAAAGITHAFSTDERVATALDDPLAYPRFTITRGITAELLLYRLGWVWR